MLSWRQPVNCALPRRHSPGQVPFELAFPHSRSEPNAIVLCDQILNAGVAPSIAHEVAQPALVAECGDRFGQLIRKRTEAVDAGR